MMIYGKNFRSRSSLWRDGKLKSLSLTRKFRQNPHHPLRQHFPKYLVFFAIFVIFYVSFVVTRRCGNGSASSVGELCAGNFLHNSEKIELGLTETEIFSEKLNFMQNDSRILAYIKQNHLYPPPSKPSPYNLNGSTTNTAAFRGIIDFVLRTLPSEPGIFVEAGAHDGEYMSNTLKLEKDFGWTGLLVEPDPKAFSKLRKKKRKAWLTDACLSVTGEPQEVIVLEVKFHLNKEFPVLARIPSDENIYEWPDSVIEEVEVKCFPLFSILSSLNMTTIDFFSLDIEGAEMKVLATIPFDSVFIKIFVIEHMWLMDGRRALVKFMKSKGYHWQRRILNGGNSDSVFVHSSLLKSSPRLNLDRQHKNLI